MEEFFIFLYPLVAIISIIGYLPQVKKLIFANRASEQTSMASWVIWTFSTFLGFGYSFFHIKDTMLIAVSGLNFVMCVLVLSLIVYNLFFRFNNSIDIAQTDNA